MFVCRLSAVHANIDFVIARRALTWLHFVSAIFDAAVAVAGAAVVVDVAVVTDRFPLDNILIV